jgi:gamma-glutamyltranspeptidase/glutathione hydrolase
MSSEVVSQLGFPLGNRLMTFYLSPAHHPNQIAPYKRPRTTISPSLARSPDGGIMAFGSMGGDQQDQWQLQFLLNMKIFGMPANKAIEAAKFSSEHFPGFFAPHSFFRNRLRVEPRVGASAIDGLRALGHEVDIGADWSEGYLLAALHDPVERTFEAAYDPRGAKGNVFPAAARCW